MPSDEAQELPQLPSRGVLFAVAALFAVLLLAVYGQVLGHEFVRWDDGLLIYENGIVRDPSLRSIAAAFTTYDPELYIPLTFLSYKIDYLLGGTHPLPYHFTNLVLHTLNALLVAWFAFLLSGRRFIALLCGLLFAVHPLHTEAVAWASARKDLLATLFFLASLIAYLSRRRSPDPNVPWPSCLFFLLALFSKVVAITLPLVLLLLDWREGRFRRETWRVLLLEKVPLFALALLFGLIALGGKTGVLASATLAETALMAGKSTVFYLLKLILPIHLSVLYPYVGIIRALSPDFLIPLLLILVLGVFVSLSLRWTREVAFAAAFFLLTLAPTFLNFAKGSGDFYFASDRYAYIPSIGFLFLAVLFLRSLAERLRGVPPAKAFLVTSGIIVVAFAVGAFLQARTWRSSEALFANVLRLYPTSHVAQNNMGNVYRLQGKLDEAITAFQAALALREHPRARSNLGAVYRRQGKISQALEEYHRAIALDPENPEPYFGIGIVYAEAGDHEQAFASYRRALEIDPGYTEARTNLGALLASEGRIDEAIAEYRRAIASDPFFAQARFNLAVALASRGELAEAGTEYRAAIRAEPSFLPARINLGILLYNEGDAPEAREQFAEVLRIDPGNARAESALRQIGR